MAERLSRCVLLILRWVLARLQDIVQWHKTDSILNSLSATLQRGPTYVGQA